MNRVFFRAIVLVSLIFLPWLGVRVMLPTMQGLEADSRLTTLVFAVWFGSPLLALVTLEFISRRALGLGFTVVRRDESHWEYWFYVSIHATMAFIVMANVFAS